MAFLTKLGSIFTQKSSKRIGSGFSATNQCIFQATIRCFSVSKVFVGGISYATDETCLRETFGKYGEVVDARVIIDRETGRSRGFGFITYSTGEEASSAIQALDGQELYGRRIRVNHANERPRYGGYGDNFGGGGSGYNNNFGGSYGLDNAGIGGGGGGGGGYNSSFSNDYGSPAGGAYQGDNANSGGGYQSNFSGDYGSNPNGGYGVDSTNSVGGYNSSNFSSNYGGPSGDYGGSRSSAPGGGDGGGFGLDATFGNAAADQATANAGGGGIMGGSAVGPSPLGADYLVDGTAGGYQPGAQVPIEMNSRDEDEDDADGFAKRA